MCLCVYDDDTGREIQVERGGERENERCADREQEGAKRQQHDGAIEKYLQCRLLRSRVLFISDIGVTGNCKINDAAREVAARMG